MFKKLLSSVLFFLPMALIATILSWFSHSDSYTYSGLLMNSLVIGSVLTIIACLLIFSIRKFHRLLNLFFGYSLYTRSDIIDPFRD